MRSFEFMLHYYTGYIQYLILSGDTTKIGKGRMLPTIDGVLSDDQESGGLLIQQIGVKLVKIRAFIFKNILLSQRVKNCNSTSDYYKFIGENKQEL